MSFFNNDRFQVILLCCIFTICGIILMRHGYIAVTTETFSWRGVTIPSKGGCAVINGFILLFIGFMSLFLAGVVIYKKWVKK